MTRNLTTLTVPFPNQLMSSSRTPTNMPTNFAREIRNMYASRSGAGTKRNGVTKVGQPLPFGGIVALFSYVEASGLVQVLALSDMGEIYLQQTDLSWVLKKEGLDVNGKMRTTHFAGKLILTNGIDPVLSWNGSEFEEVYAWVREVSATLSYVDASTFTVESLPEFYQVGTSLQLMVDGVLVDSHVVAMSEVGDVLTVTLADSVLSAGLESVDIKMFPPRFQYIYAAHDRLWGFGSGALRAGKFSAIEHRSRVYYTFGVNDETAWQNEEGLLQYINMADKMPSDDELVAMAVKDGLSVFFFKNVIQIWSGSDPTLTGDFSWNKTVPIGAVHGDLVLEMPNDVAFFTRYGARTLSRLLQTEQLDIADMGSEMTLSISDAVGQMGMNDEAYRNVHRFYHAKQGWFGFRPALDVFVFQVGALGGGWTLFDGAFSDSTAFLNVPSGDLMLAIGAQLYIYDESVYADDFQPIHTKWWTPWLTPSASSKRWANKYTEILSEQSQMVEASLKRFKIYNSSSYQETTLPLMSAADHFDEAYWDESYFDNGAKNPQKVRDHFMADVFSYAVESSTTTGPMTIFGLKFYGIQEK